jgi:hypothetical protein
MEIDTLDSAIVNRCPFELIDKRSRQDLLEKSIPSELVPDSPAPCKTFRSNDCHAIESVPWLAPGTNRQLAEKARFGRRGGNVLAGVNVHR